VGPIERVRLSLTPPPFISNKRRYGRRAEGIRYEGKVHGYLDGLHEGCYVSSPWFVFTEVGVERERWCQPDALLFDIPNGRITIVECKLQHTADAWWQLKWLYLPVISRAFPNDKWEYALCEVVKWFDPAVAFPEKVKLRKNVKDTVPGELGVHIWKP